MVALAVLADSRERMANCASLREAIARPDLNEAVAALPADSQLTLYAAIVRADKDGLFPPDVKNRILSRAIAAEVKQWASSVEATVKPAKRQRATTVGIDALPRELLLRIVDKMVPDMDSSHLHFRGTEEWHSGVAQLKAQVKDCGRLALVSKIFDVTTIEDGETRP